jgi:adenylosuccinate synthase
MAEAASEAAPGAIGTTGRGIGWAYRDKAARTGLRAGDLLDAAGFRERAARNLERLKREWPEAEGLGALTADQVWSAVEGERSWVEPMLTDVGLELHRVLERGGGVLLEGAQGTLLDLDHGTYPYVTSSNASALGACAGVGLSPRRLDRVVGVAKAYATRVGHGPFPTEMAEELAARLREAGEEYGATTGRPRRCGWLDLVALRYAARLNGLDELVITKLDVLDEFEEIQVAVAYECQGKLYEELPGPPVRLEQCRPVYRAHPGWKRPTSGARRWSDLPLHARDYLGMIEADVRVPIGTVSVGAEREAEVKRE